jgi:uncharacterized protein (DUF2384 family)
MEQLMPTTASPRRQTSSVKRRQPPLTPPIVGVAEKPATYKLERSSHGFWKVRTQHLRDARKEFQTLIDRVLGADPVVLFDALEDGVPTTALMLFAQVLDVSLDEAMSLFGVSATTFRRKDELGEALPESVGYRVMGFLRVVAKLQSLLAQSGAPDEVAKFDIQNWVKDWVRQPLPEFGGKTPIEMLRNPEGQRALEQLLERMRGGLPA